MEHERADDSSFFHEFIGGWNGRTLIPTSHLPKHNPQHNFG
jgi:hypothetical protein